MALTLEEIWQSRNNSFFHNATWDVTNSIHHIHIKAQEFSLVLAPPCTVKPCLSQQKWSPPLGTIKLNVDAATSNNSAAIAVVARNHLGVPVKVWARSIKLTTPLQAETEALLWAMQLARIEKWNHVVFEGDAKICIDAIKNPSNPCPWTLIIPIRNICALLDCFSSCFFVWVNRTCNGVAHQAARFALLSRLSFFFNKDNLPPAL